MFLASSFLFAEVEVKRAEPFLQKTEDWVSVGLLVAALLAGAVVIWIVERWRKSASAAAKQADYGQLSDYREMFDRGEITAEEYEKLRLRVSERVKPPPALPGQAAPLPNPAAPPETPGHDSPA